MNEITLQTVATFNFGAGTQPEDVALDPVTHNVFVTLNGSGQLAEISGETCNAVATTACNEQTVLVGAGSLPTGVAADAASGTVYVAASALDAIGVYSESSLTLIGEAAAGLNPDGVAVLDAVVGGVQTFEVYTADFGGDVVSEFDGATCNATDVAGCPTLASPPAQAAVGLEPTSLALDAALNLLYVSNFDSNTVTVLTASTGAFVTTINLFPVVTEPLGLTIGPGGNSLLIACAGPGRPVPRRWRSSR